MSEKLTEDQLHKLLEALRVKWGARQCPMCGTAGFTVEGSLFMLLQYTPGVGLRLGGPVFPVVPVTCNNCGNTILVNAVVADLIPAGNVAEASGDH